MVDDCSSLVLLSRYRSRAYSTRRSAKNHTMLALNASPRWTLTIDSSYTMLYKVEQKLIENLYKPNHNPICGHHPWAQSHTLQTPTLPRYRHLRRVVVVGAHDRRL